MSTATGPQQGVFLLSIDGGGIRGLSCLIMLRDIMQRVQHRANLQTIPHPYEVFDLAGGTSTGGLIAIMLFRLRMSVNDAIKIWDTLARQIFSTKKLFFKDGKYRASRLEDAVVQVIREAGLADNPHDQPLHCNAPPRCFVSTLCETDLGHPLLLCSYKPNTSPLPKSATIIEAARATTAAPTYFKAATVGGLPLRFVNGGLCCNNPVKFVVEEAMTLFPNHPISLLLSLGTGERSPIKLPLPSTFQVLVPSGLARAAVELATDTRQEAEAMKLTSRQPSGFKYVRLNVDQGLQTVALDEWEKLGQVTEITDAYLGQDHVREEVELVVQVLANHFQSMINQGSSQTP